MSCGAKLQPEWSFCASCRQPVSRSEHQDPGTTEIPAAPSAGSDVPADSPKADSPTVESAEQNPAPQDGATPVPENTPNESTPAGPGGTPPGTPPGPGGPDGPSGPEGPVADGTPAPGRKSRAKAFILAGIAVVLVAVGVGAFLFIQNIIRGGAGSPEQAAEKLIESIESKDAIGLVTMVAPAERDALDRLREGILEKTEDFGLLEAANKVGDDTGEDDTEFSLDGITVTFENAEPEVTEVDDQLALLKFSTGTVRVQIDPEQTEGAIRSGLEAAEEMDPVDETTDLAEMGTDGGPLLLAAVKDGGRWYLSPLYTGLEMATQGSDTERGTLPEPTDGSDSPAEAAEALLGAVPGILESGKFTDLGNYLASHEGNAVHYYGGALDSMDGGMDAGIELSANSFRDAERDGGRGRATVDTLEVDFDGDSMRLTADCIEFDGADEVCGNGSGYVMPGGGSGADAIMGALSPLGLSSVKEDGAWKVSLLDTTTDWALQWIDSLTREQALAMLDLARSEDAAGTMTLDEDTDVVFNSAGYAVLNLELDEATTLDSPDDFSSFTVYSQDGKDEVTTSSEYLPQETPAGKYKVVIFAGDDWAEKFAEDGNGVEHSQAMSFEEAFTTPAVDGIPGTADDSLGTIDGVPGEDYGFLTLTGSPGPTAEVRLEVPARNDVDLVINAMGSYGEWVTPGTLVATLDGREYRLPVTNDMEELVIPYAAGGEERILELELKKGEGSGEEVDYLIEFE